jgi:hypothetical protein
MKTKFITSIALLVSVAITTSASVFAASVTDVFQLIFPKRTIDRSEDINKQRDRPTQQNTLYRGKSLFESGKEMRQGTSYSDYRIRSRHRRTPDYYNVEIPGLQPWESLTYKARVKKAYDLTNQYDMRFQKPKIEAKRKIVRYNRKYRSHRNELSEQRSGKSKLYRLYFQ